MPEENNINFYRNPPKDYNGSITEWRQSLIDIMYKEIFEEVDRFINTGYESATIRMHPKDILWLRLQDMDQKHPASPVKASLIADRNCNVGEIIVEIYIHHALSFEEFTKENVNMFVKGLMKKPHPATLAFSITLLDEEEGEN